MPTHRKESTSGEIDKVEIEIPYQMEMSFLFFYNVDKKAVITRSTLYID